MKPKTEKQVQIPLRLLYDIEAIFEGLGCVLSDSLHPDDIKFINEVKNEIQGKFERMERHNLFSAYKSAEQGSEVREHFRQRYLDKAGIHKDFRSNAEIDLTDNAPNNK